MYIANCRILKDDSKIYKCGATIGKYLIKKGFPLLGKENEIMVFAYTNALKEQISHLPIILKILRGMRLIYG